MLQKACVLDFEKKLRKVLDIQTKDWGEGR